MRVLLIMFLNYLPNEMIEVMGITMIFAFLIGTILTLLFTSDQANTKNRVKNHTICNARGSLKNRTVLFFTVM